MTRQALPGILAMAAIVVASNILVQYLLGDWLTWGALTYPLAFLVTDLMNRLYGPALARQVVFTGFVVGVFCSLVASQFDATTFRIAVGSGTAFLVAQLLDVAVFDRMRGRAWWQAPLASTVIGSTVDTALFFSIAFAAALNGLEPANAPVWAQEALPLLGGGPVAPLWVSLAVADWGVKLTLALIALIPFRLIVARAGGGMEGSH
ncbi:VUT family protein [Rhodovulum sp. 12E13]|uniref:queuosine precursor transporter n=1 Tax=Rhodovulum sp. 12E13 TaxID=2203891 RepID=UPI000E184F7D|nr:queuosine precursor transporter [Rhodovulum sp. 12E13]RDC74140.1 VUT family protein [Rhodovulum sp. 12E13]